MSEAEYCNISGNEVKVRYATGALGLIATILVVFLLPNGILKAVVIFFTGFIAALGFIQARRKYCVSVGITNLLRDFSGHKHEVLLIGREILESSLVGIILAFAVLLTS